MEYVEAAKARSMRGLRLALTVGVPGPWSESAKKIFEYKGIEYVPVAQYAGRSNEDLVEWTGIRNAPVAVYGEEAPRGNFQDIVALAERLQPEPRLVPQNQADRWLCYAISTEICGASGFGWKRRLTMLNRPVAPTRPRPSEKSGIDPDIMQLAYKGSEAEYAIAEQSVAEILDALAARLQVQRDAGSDYFVGDGLTACDIHWACFSALLQPLPPAVNPMPDWLRPVYSYLGPVIEPHKHTILIEHRDRVFERHLPLPLDY